MSKVKVFQLLSQGFQKVVNLFKKNPKTAICGYREDQFAARTLEQSTLYGKEGEKIANVRKYSHPWHNLDANNNVVNTTSVITRQYIPAKGTRLADMGVSRIYTAKTPKGNTFIARVSLPNGINQPLNRSDFRNYVKIMKV